MTNRKVTKKIKKKRLSEKKRGAVAVAKNREQGTSLDTLKMPYIRFIGLGGGAGAVLDEVSKYIQKNKSVKSKADFYCINSDGQALKALSSRVKKVLVGDKVSGGFGTGGDVASAKKIVEEDFKKIDNILKNRDFFVIVSCLGGGFGSGSLASIAKKINSDRKISIGFFAMPFAFEGQKRMHVAKKSLDEAKDFINAFSVIYNEKIFDFIDKKTPLSDAFSMVNRKLAENIEGFLEMIYLPGLINIDFADLQTTLSGKGQLFYLYSIVFNNIKSFENFSEDSFFAKVNEYSLQSHEKFIPEKILFNITASDSLKLQDINNISRIVTRENPRAKVIFGVSYNNVMKDKVRIAILLVGGVKEISGKKVGSKKIAEKKDLASEKAIEKSGVEEKGNKNIENSKEKLRSARKKGKISKKTAKTENKVFVKKKTTKKTKKSKAKRLSKKKTAAKTKQTKQLDLLSKKRRTPLDVKELKEMENKNIEEQESKWDIPAFLTSKKDKKQ